MNHVAVQHADGRERNLVANDGPVTSPVSKPTAVSDWRIVRVEVLHGTSFHCICNCLPGKATFACADDPSLVVVLVEWML